MQTAIRETPTPKYSARNTYAIDELPIAQIQASTFNPRKRFDPEQLQQLADSIRLHGLIEPLVVRPIGDATATMYEIVAGERRFRAAGLAGLRVVPVTVREDLDDAEALEIAICENLHRADLDPIEEAEGYRALNKVLGMKQAQIAERVNRSQPAIANALRLLELPEDVQERIRAGELSVSHGVSLARFKDFPPVASAIALHAVDQATPSKTLEGEKVPFAWILSREEVITRVFRQAYEQICREDCPFGAFRARDHEAYCLRPDHHRELNAQAVAIEDAEATVAQTALAEQGVDVGALLRLRDLKYDTFKNLNYTPVPAGCSEDCACRAQGLSGDDKTIVAICTNVKRFEGLGQAQSRRENLRIRALSAELKTALSASLSSLEEPGPRELAVLIAELRVIMGVSSRLAEGAKALGIPDLDFMDRAAALNALARCSTTELTTLLLRAVLSKHIEDGARLANEHELALPRWYLGEREPASDADPGDPEADDPRARRAGAAARGRGGNGAISTSDAQAPEGGIHHAPASIDRDHRQVEPVRRGPDADAPDARNRGD